MSLYIWMNNFKMSHIWLIIYYCMHTSMMQRYSYMFLYIISTLYGKTIQYKFWFDASYICDTIYTSVTVFDRQLFSSSAFVTQGSSCLSKEQFQPIWPMIKACNQNRQWLATEHLFLQIPIDNNTKIAPHQLLCRSWSLYSGGTQCWASG